MLNKIIMIAGTAILSMMVLIAATNIDSYEASSQDRTDHKLSGVVVDADTQDGIANATVYLKKKDDDGMQTDRTHQQDQYQQDQDQQDRQDRAVEQDQGELDKTTTDEKGEFELENIEQILNQNNEQRIDAQDHQYPDQQRQQEGMGDDLVVLVVEAEGYETVEKEINLSDYLDRNRDAMDRDRDRDRDYDRDQDMKRDRDKEYDEKDKDKDKIKIELTRSNN
jgi:hypothetical protein